MNHIKRVIDFCRDTRWDDLPDTVQHQGKRALLDTLGVLIAGGITPASRIMNGFVEDQMTASSRQVSCTVISTGKKVSAVGAALANGIAANGLDMDDGYNAAKGHPGAALLPVLLASVELTNGISGGDFLAALVVGYELSIRAALIRHATYYTYHSTGSWGAIGGAAAGGKILGLDSEQIRNAMGIAEYFAPLAPMMKGIDVVAMTKDSISWGCMAAMSSILLASKGFTGIEPIYEDGPGPELSEGLGKEWLVLDLYHKPYACCHWVQPPIAGVFALLQKYHLSHEQIKKIRVFSFKEATKLSCAAPRDTEEAQYNMAYGLACAVIKGKLGPEEVTPPTIFDPEILKFMDRIESIEDHKIQKSYPEKRQAMVEITTDDGKVFRSGLVDALWGGPKSRPSDEDLNIKFQAVTKPILTSKKQRLELQNLIWDLENEPTAARLIDMAKSLVSN